MTDNKMTDNFCSAPWVSLFYQTNQASVCCINKNSSTVSPMRFISGDTVKNLKKDFLNNKRPESCSTCWQLEDSGNKSVRSLINSTYPLDRAILTDNTPTEIKYLELRISNLCNFSCRMCGPFNSNQFDKEVKSNDSLQRYFRPVTNITKFDSVSMEQIKTIAKNLDVLNLTGGEPMLIKEYHDLFDYLIENQYNENIMLQITTNGSVFNPKLMEKIIQFKSVRIVVSIDGVNEVGEYQRYGSLWNTVKENFYSYLDLPKIEVVVNSVSSGYTILDTLNLVNFLIETRQIKREFIWVLWRAVNPPQIDFSLLNEDLTKQALEQVQLSLTKLLSSEFNDRFFSHGIQELKSFLVQLEKNDFLNFKEFIDFTKVLDDSRNESFEKVFGYKIY